MYFKATMSSFFICRASSRPLQSRSWGWPLSALGGWSVKTAWTCKHPRLAGLLWWAPRFTPTWRTARERRSTSENWTSSVSETINTNTLDTYTQILHFYCTRTHCNLYTPGGTKSLFCNSLVSVKSLHSSPISKLTHFEFWALKSHNAIFTKCKVILTIIC